MFVILFMIISFLFLIFSYITTKSIITKDQFKYYKVIYDKKAIKSLVKIDKGQQNIILAWI